MIVLDKERKLITLHTRNTTYQMKVWDYNVLLHTYYGPRIAGRRTNLIQINIVDHLLYPQILELACGNRGYLRQKPFDSSMHPPSRKRRIRLRVRDIMLIADLNHLSVTLHSHQKLTA